MAQFNGTAAQIENNTNKVTALSADSTDIQYPSAKAAYDALGLKANTTDLPAAMASKADKANMFYPNNQYGGIVVTDFNAINTSGYYTGYGTATGAPNTSYSWFLYHHNSNTDTATAYQRAIAYDAGLIVYDRVKIGSIWGAWTDKIATHNTSGTAHADIRTQINERASYGVYSGLGVTAQATPNMTVSVATGTVYMPDNTRYTPTANTALAITAANATNPRIDIVYVSSTGVISYLAGTAAASPTVPITPTDGLLLAQISVAANVTTVVLANIADRRKYLWTEAWIVPTLLNGAVTNATNPLMYRKNQFGVVEFKGRVTVASAAVVSFTLPAGYRVSSDGLQGFTVIKDAYSFGYAMLQYNSMYVSVGSIDFSGVRYTALI